MMGIGTTCKQKIKVIKEYIIFLKIKIKEKCYIFVV